jgi:hypothetical protein
MKRGRRIGAKGLMVTLAVGCMVVVILELQWRDEVEAQCYVRDFANEAGCCETLQITGAVRPCQDAAGNLWQCPSYTMIQSQLVPKIREVTSGGQRDFQVSTLNCTYTRINCGSFNQQCLPEDPPEMSTCQNHGFRPVGDRCQ